VRERDASVSVLRAAPVIRYPWKDIGRWPVRCDRLRASLAQLAPSFALLDERAILAYQIGRAIARLRTRARIAPLPSILSRAFPAEPSRGGGMGLGWGGAAIFPGTICAPRLVISRSSPGRSRGNTAVDISNIRTSDAICIARAGREGGEGRGWRGAGEVQRTRVRVFEQTSTHYIRVRKRYRTRSVQRAPIRPFRTTRTLMFTVSSAVPREREREREREGGAITIRRRN